MHYSVINEPSAAELAKLTSLGKSLFKIITNI